MFFSLTTLNLAQFLNETATSRWNPAEGKPSMQAGQAVEHWKLQTKKEKGRMTRRAKGRLEYLLLSCNCETEIPRIATSCDQLGPRAANCKMPTRVNPRQANMVNDNGVLGATVHVCVKQGVCFTLSEQMTMERQCFLYMGNSATTDIKDEGDIILRMTSDKELKLTNVLYVPEIHKNLVSGWLLNKFGFHLVFESDNKDEDIDKFVLYKTEVENQLDRKIKVVRSDKGGEYVSPFADLCAKHGIRHEFTAPYSPQQNGEDHCQKG
ncbi:enoyl-[acyl-carrier-protein] reductase [NADH], chloroplastic [Tanacetum coccineum]